VPAHCRMREFDRDLIREGHYGQRPSAPHQQAGHMSAPNQCCIHVKKLLSVRRRAHMTLSEPYSANKDDRDDHSHPTCGKENMSRLSNR
jgi:hypothetical protein